MNLLACLAYLLVSVATPPTPRDRPRSDPRKRKVNKCRKDSKSPPLSTGLIRQQRKAQRQARKIQRRAA